MLNSTNYPKHISRKSLQNYEKRELSVPSRGAKGGYELAKRAQNISFWDIVEAIEGPSDMVQYAEIRQNNILADENDACNCSKPCLIKVVMQEAEDQMRNYLSSKNLAWLKEEVYKDFTDTKKQSIEEWLSKSIK